MRMDDSSNLGIVAGSAGETSVQVRRHQPKLGHSTRKLLSCSSRAGAGDLPEGSLRRTTSKIFAFIGTEFFRMMAYQAQALPGHLRLQICTDLVVLHTSLQRGIPNGGAVRPRSR